MKIALVHDYLREYGGAERVLEAMHDIWPEAPLYTSFVDWKALGDHADRFRDWDIRNSWVDRNPFVKRWHSPLRFLTPRIWRSLDLSGFDVVLSSSGWYMCRGVNTAKVKGKKPVFIDYIHHPPRNMYGYETGSKLQRYAVVRAYAHVINLYLRRYDYHISQDVDHFIANSEETKRRVEKFYRRDATVIYPPVEEPRFKIQDSRLKKKKYYLSVGRLMYAKRVDIAIRVCNAMKLPLKVVGTGRDEAQFRELAGPTIEFVGAVSDEKLSQLYAGANALIFTALDEEFGIVPVEAMMHGTPVIGLAQGGVKETVMDPSTSSGQATGILFDEPTEESLTAAMKRFQKKTFDEKAIIKHAKTFSKARFQKQLKAFVQKHAKSST